MCVATPSEQQNLIHQFARPLAGAADLLKDSAVAAPPCVRRVPHLGVTKNGAKNVVEIMGYAAGQRADRLQPPRVVQASLQAHPVLLERLSVKRVGDGVEPHSQ